MHQQEFSTQFLFPSYTSATHLKGDAATAAPLTFNKRSKCHNGRLVKFRFDFQHLDDFYPKHVLHLLTQVAFECD